MRLNEKSTQKIDSLTWDPLFYKQSTMFTPLSIFMQNFFEQHSDWPSLANYNDFLQKLVDPIVTELGFPLTCVEQSTGLCQFEEGYEQRVYLKGEIQTRFASWHDLFNILCWGLFPKSKALLNALQYQDFLLQRDLQSKNRTPLQNALAHFDECGVIVLSSSEKLLELIENFEWKSLFCDHREQVESQMQFIIFGHGLYEKSLNPYIGLTGKALLFLVEDSELNQPLSEILPIIDKIIAKRLSLNSDVSDRIKLTPLPILGIPGWCEANQSNSFYDNINYFRPGRTR